MKERLSARPVLKSAGPQNSRRRRTAGVFSCGVVLVKRKKAGTDMEIACRGQAIYLRVLSSLESGCNREMCCHFQKRGIAPK